MIKNKFVAKRIIKIADLEKGKQKSEDTNSDIGMEAKNFEIAESFVKNIADKLYALNKKAKEYRGSGVSVDDDGNVYKDKYSQGEAERKKLYDIKNKIIEKFGTPTGKTHTFEKGIGDEFSLEGQGSFHNYYFSDESYLSSHNQKVLKKCFSDIKNILRKYKVPDDSQISTNAMDFGSIDYNTNLVSEKNENAILDKFLKKYPEYQTLGKVRTNALSGFNKRYDFADAVKQNLSWTKSDLEKEIKKIDGFTSVSSKRKYQEQRKQLQNAIDKINELTSSEKIAEYEKKYLEVKKQMNELSANISQAEKEIHSLLKKNGYLYQIDKSKIENIGNISSENTMNIELTENDLKFLEALANDKTSKSLTEIWNNTRKLK